MLEVLKIKNLAVIDEVEVSFKSGLNIISGETGAGKSIVIEAISLILGGRASSDLIRTGCDEMTVEGLFQISELEWMNERLARLGYPAESSHLLVKRLVHRSGRNRIYVNGELATLSLLQDLCSGLVDLCGQHEHQSLLKSITQIDLIDRYGASLDKRATFSEAFSHLQSLVKESEVLRNQEDERARRADFLQFQIEELKKAELTAGEEEKLAAEKKLLQSAEARLALLDEVSQTIDGTEDESGVLSLLRNGFSRFKSLVTHDAALVPTQESLSRALAEVEEVSLFMNRYRSSVSLNEERLAFVGERLTLLAQFRRKYGASVEEMIQTLTRLETEYTGLETLASRLGDLENQIEKVRAESFKKGKDLSEARKKASKLFSESVTQELKDLKMSDAIFKVDLSFDENVESWSLTFAGNKIDYLMQTNRGETMQSISKIASGGELSRLMLAVRRVIADRGGIGVYLFDEIDSGMGGQAAFVVGKKLKSVAKYNQVICITHLPQVAAFADHHLSVQKNAKGTRTLTEVVQLSSKERVNEIARMLTGAKITSASLTNAKDLVASAQA